MGLLDNNNAARAVYQGSENIGRLANLATFEDFDIKEVSDGNKSLMAVFRDVAAFVENGNVLISTTGVSGELTEVVFNSTNFPHLIEGSQITYLAIVPYSRTYSTSLLYQGNVWRLCVFTNKGQIYHNFPARNSQYDGSPQSGDIYRFDESVVWDSVDRQYPVKTTTGDDATLIATGKYRYLPCLPDSMYEMHPGINVDNGYNNGGFGAVRTYTEGGVEKKRARFWFPIRGIEEANSFRWMNGFVQDLQLTMFATYLDDITYKPRLCVFSTNNGREWFVQWECGTDGRILTATEEEQRKMIVGPGAQFSEFGDNSLRIKYGTETMSDSSAYTVKYRAQWVPSETNKEPELTHKFAYGTPVSIQSITSDATNGIVVTTASAHSFLNGEVVVFNKVGSSTSWDWLCSEDETDMSSGNGMIWKAEVLTSTTFRLMLELKNPEENLPIRHIHALNKCKDGYAVSCGEEYPHGWVLYIVVRGNDTYSNLFAGTNFKKVRLTSTATAIQRLLGLELTEEEGNKWYAGLDTSILPRDNVTMPNGRTDSWSRNSTGIFKGDLVDIDYFDNAECILETDQPAYFFREVQGIMIYVGQRGLLCLSKDRGKTWTQYQLKSNLYGMFWHIGTDREKRIYIRARTGTATLVICPKV